MSAELELLTAERDEARAEWNSLNETLRCALRMLLEFEADLNALRGQFTAARWALRQVAASLEAEGHVGWAAKVRSIAGE